jgi:hypothetical protein
VDPVTGLDYMDKIKFLTLPGFVVQLVASRYTDYATATFLTYVTRNVSNIDIYFTGVFIYYIQLFVINSMVLSGFS